MGPNHKVKLGGNASNQIGTERCWAKSEISENRKGGKWDDAGNDQVRDTGERDDVRVTRSEMRGNSDLQQHKAKSQAKIYQEMRGQRRSEDVTVLA